MATGEVTGWIRRLLGVLVSGNGVGTTEKHANKIVLGTGVNGVYGEESRTLTITAAGGTGGTGINVSGGGLAAEVGVEGLIFSEDFHLTQTPEWEADVSILRPAWAGGTLDSDKRPRRIEIGTGLVASYAEPSGVPTITLTASSDTNQPGLLDVFEADYDSVELSGYNNVAAWRGRCGHVIRPLTNDMTVDTTALSGGRRGILFNGTTHGMTLELPELKSNSSSLVFVAHVFPANNNNDQVLANLWADEGATRVLLLGGGSGGYVTRVNGHSSTGILQSVVDHTNQWYETELVLEGVRDASGMHLHLMRNGVRRAGDEGTIGCDRLVRQPVSTTVSIGCQINSEGATTQHFQGVIRRIAVYGYTHFSSVVTNAAARSAAWLGN
jgi:hypothetical protein